MDSDFLKKYTETGSREGAKLTEKEAEYENLAKFRSAIKKRTPQELLQWIKEHDDIFGDECKFIDTDDYKYFESHPSKNLKMIFNITGLSHIYRINSFLNAANEELPYGGYFGGHSRTSLLKHKIIVNKWPGVWGKIVFAFHYFWHRICPKLILTSWFYFAVTKGRNRSLSRVEILGRFCRAGFEIVDERFSNGEFYVLGRKVAEPRHYKARLYGPIIKLTRIGYKGKRIGVYKFRIMYPYAEYLQPYMMEHEGLRKGGKFKNDYRINFWGRMFRSNMLDELPMILNMFKGQMKLVGVRPLSSAYFSLYSPEMQKLRVTVKPGLLPPFYYDEKTPETLEEIQESEKRYIEAYKEHPFRTDWRYFWRIVRNVVFKKKRSH